MGSVSSLAERSHRRSTLLRARPTARWRASLLDRVLLDDRFIFLSWRESTRVAPSGLTSERAREIETFLRDAVIEDFTRRPPDLVLIDQVKHRRVFRGKPFDFLAFLLEDPRFERIWSGYRDVEGVERFSAAVRR